MLPSEHEILQSAWRPGGARNQMAQNFGGDCWLRASSGPSSFSSREMAENFGGDLGLRSGSGWLLRRRQRLVFRQHVACGIEHREAMIAQPEFVSGLQGRGVQRFGPFSLFGLALVFRFQRGQEALI